MKVKHIVCLAVILLVLAFAAAGAETALNDAIEATVSNGTVIVIDPGHGGSDPGAVSENGTREADLNVAISKYLKEYLRSYGFEVVLTREYEGLSKAERKSKIASQNPDIVISIHLNIFSDKSVHGAETYYYAGNDEGKRLAECIQLSLKNELGGDNKRTVKGVTNLFVLKASEAPSVLVECGYLSNETEEIKILTPEYQKKVAFSIYCGIMAYLAS